MRHHRWAVFKVQHLVNKITLFCTVDHVCVYTTLNNLSWMHIFWQKNTNCFQ